MIENIKEADLIIFCITDPSRLSSPFKLPITTWQASDKNAFIEIDDGGKRYRRSHGIPSTKFDFHKLQEAIKCYYKMLKGKGERCYLKYSDTKLKKFT